MVPLHGKISLRGETLYKTGRIVICRYWYLTFGLPTVLGLTTLPFALACVHALRYRAVHPERLVLLQSIVFTLIIYSLLPHKEFRFILPILPMCLFITSEYLSQWSRKANLYAKLALSLRRAESLIDAFFTFQGANLVRFAGTVGGKYCSGRIFEPRPSERNDGCDATSGQNCQRLPRRGWSSCEIPIFNALPFDAVLQSHSPKCFDALPHLRTELQRAKQLRGRSRSFLQWSVGLVPIPYSRLSEIGIAHPSDYVRQVGGKIAGSSGWLSTDPFDSTCWCKFRGFVGSEIWLWLAT